MKKAIFRTVTGESKWIEAHDNTDIGADFYNLYDSDEKDKLNCVFTVFHTHKPCKAKAVSEKVAKLKDELDGGSVARL
jgi:hypothetical protein